MAKRRNKSDEAAPSSADAGKSSAGAPKSTSAQLRKLDREIVELLNARAAAALTRGDDAVPLGDEEVTAAADTGVGPLPAVAVRAVFRELLSGIRAVGGPLRVAYLGPEFTYSHLAAIARFGQSAELVPVGSIAGVFAEVQRSQAAFGVVPIENSTDGRVADTLECFSKVQGDAGSPAAGVGDDPARSEEAVRLQICAEVPLRIHHCLLGRGRRSDIHRVCSKPQALSQCRNWLSTHLPGAVVVEMASTAEAARLAGGEPGTAAIASEQAATNHHLDVLARNIEDNADNVTRFAVIGAAAAPRTGRDKTALVFEAPHKPGALADAMAIFKKLRLNLTWIESFPIPAARGRYLFFVEFQGHAADLRSKRAIAALGKKSLRLMVLGSYAEAAVIG